MWWILKSWMYGLSWVLFLSCSTVSKNDTLKTENFHSPSTHTPNIRTWQDISQSGELRVAIPISPISFFIHNGTPLGYEFEVISQIANDLKLTLRIIRVKTKREGSDLLNQGKVDLLSYNLPPSINDNKANFINTHPILFSEHVLIQKKPANWNRISYRNLERQLVNDIYELENKEVFVIRDSPQALHLVNTITENGLSINIHELNQDWQQEELINLILDEKIEYAICDKHIGKLYANYHPSLDIKTKASLQKRTSFTVKNNNTELLDIINLSIDKNQKNGINRNLYLKYFHRNSIVGQQLIQYNHPNYVNQVSKYDTLIKNKSLDWDWRLLASQIYHESNFHPSQKSWMGAIGLMQVLPSTGEMHHISNLSNPSNNVTAGVKHLSYLENLWADKIICKEERLKFILASYNAGPGHVFDAQRLARKNGCDPSIWKNNVEKYLLLKRIPRFYNDEVCRYGYCNGTEATDYVDKVISTYNRYQEIIPL